MLNPIVYTERVVSDFLRYQITTYPFSDTNLYEQMRSLLNLEETRATPLLKGPYISLSRTFRRGAKVSTLIAENVLHPHLANIAPFPHVYGHQETAIRSISAGKTTLVSTGTGSGKTEVFLYSIISRCLQLRDEGAPPGIIAVLVYPMNALAEDQLGRLRDLLVGTGISFGMYVGKTPEKEADVGGVRLPSGASRADYREEVERAAREKLSHAVHPYEERASRESMRESGNQPRILLTNINQLELLLTRQRDVELFDGARLEFLVFDEAHTFKGTAGAEVACLIRRLRAFCGRSIDDTVCVATSATIADPQRGGAEAGREFASRFFGVPKDRVEIVGEEYEPDMWSASREVTGPLSGNPATYLKEVLEAVSEGNGSGLAIQNVIRAMIGRTIEAHNWQESLYDLLASSEVVYQIVEALASPRMLAELVVNLSQTVGRTVPEEEVLTWLTLGAASRKEGRPLLRPVVHAFISGVGGAVVTFPESHNGPKLWLSSEDATEEDSEGLSRLPVMTCTTCGQHYFFHFVADFRFFEKRPEGGEAVQNRVIWRPLDETRGGNRIVLLDRLVTTEEGDEEEDPNNIADPQISKLKDPSKRLLLKQRLFKLSEAPRSTTPIYFCRYCGTLHPQILQRCDGCGIESNLVPLFVVQQKEDYPGQLTSCLACQALGRRRPGGYREPARPVRALTVSDVHVLAQNMIQHAERRRLLVFADNRQDAAFQAGWMQDHARRFRFRALMYQRIQQGPISIGDLTAHLDDVLEADDDLSQALVPEVWRIHRKEAEGVRHSQERKSFLRIQVLREITTGVKQRIGLEPWGRMIIEYSGLNSELPFFDKWAKNINVLPQELVDGVASLLDVNRRNTILLDREGRIFSKLWLEGDREIQQGYLPLMPGIPRGLKLKRSANDDKTRIQQWLSDSGDTLPRQVARRWGIHDALIDDFFEELWHVLKEDLDLLVPVTLNARRNRALPKTAGAHQIDADKLRLAPHIGTYRCNTCRRAYTRPTPHLACMAWRCKGTLKFEDENKDDYDLMVLDQQFAMIRPSEHSAQVPAAKRELLERDFKSDNEKVNTLVCTPTLELGVDIGTLDAVLMRNVPPLPSNYWQRAGRAGRRHRMAVNVTYARPVSHDRAYYKDPLKLLEGIVYPPRFNLRNGLMVRKHVHAAILTNLHSLARPNTNHLSRNEKSDINEVLRQCFPNQVKEYLFDDNGNVRNTPLDVTMLTNIISKYEDIVVRLIQEVFAQGWPAEDADVIAQDTLRDYIINTGEQLTRVIARIARRLQWAREQVGRLEISREQKGTLDPDEDSLYLRCDRLIKKLKGIQPKRRRDIEGFDETNTYSVLAFEGFLPGYGLDVGSVLGTAQVPRQIIGLSDFELRRPPAVALREYAPGNLIYANGHRFIPRFYHLEPADPTLFQVDVANEAVVEVGTATAGIGAGLNASLLRAIPMSDVDLPHQSHITDEEDYRFQMGVSINGYEQNRHGGGIAYGWSSTDVLFRRGVYLRLVNVGAAKLVRGKGILGYPVCLVCGQSRSPLASDADREKFAEDHLERCGQRVQPTGFFTDIVADAMTMQSCSNREEAYSVAEAIRIGASNVLDMETEDLQILAIGHPGSEETDILIYDPMPGGSGLLEHLISRWSEVVHSALNVVDDCASECETACVDCLLTFRNAYYHRHLNRHTAAEKIKEWGQVLLHKHELPPKLPTTEATRENQPVNFAETTLRDMLRRAGFPDPIPQKSIDLGRPLGSTIPDFFYDDPDDPAGGICIYLDGMSAHIHGNQATQRRDREMRDELRNRGFEVIEIPYGNLSDRQAMIRYFFRLGRFLLDREQATRVRDNAEWFELRTTAISYENEANPPSSNLDEVSTLYLNVYFPDYDEGTKLKVGVAARLNVNLSHEIKSDQLGKSEHLDEKAITSLYAVEYVDVLVLSPGANIVPLRSRILLNSEERTAHFNVTPIRSGIFNLTVILLARNEPIHTMMLKSEAIDG
jgi:ATP-dependent helicase YprA (DUF1998 family)